jgi:hypothetical protein
VRPPAASAGCVTRGLDPRVHHSRKRLFAKRMDFRVKPGNDQCRALSAHTLQLLFPLLITIGKQWIEAGDHFLHLQVASSHQARTLVLGSFRQNAFPRSSSRPSVARAGTHEHRLVIMGPRLRGDDGIERIRFAKSRSGSFRQNAPPSPFRVPDTTQYEAQRNDALQTRDSPWRSRLSDAPLRYRSRCIASGTRNGLARIRTPIHFSKSPSRSRARIAASGPCLFASRTPTRVGGAPRDVGVLGGAPMGVHITRHAGRLARRLASHDAGRSPLGAPPWRFWAPGAALSSRIARLSFRFSGHPDRLQRAPRSQVVVPGGRGPCLPRRRLQAAAAGRHASLRLQDASGRRPSMSKAGNLSTTDASRSQ